MPRIGVIDDKAEFRSTTQHRLELCLPDGWEPLSLEPMESLSDYPAWIHDNDVAVLLLDERLTDEPLSRGGHSSYEGHDLLSFLRERMREFPIYVVTAQAIPGELVQAQSQADNLLEKTDLFANIEVHIARMLRQGMRWRETNERSLARLAELSRKAATANLDETERRELDSIRTSLCVTEPVSTRRVEVLEELEASLKTLAAAIEKLSGGQPNG